MPSQRLAIFLLRDIQDLEDALSTEASAQLQAGELTRESGLTGRFYARRSFTRAPAWAAFLNSVVDGGVRDVRSASASGLLLLQVDSHTFALTFGYGRAFLDPAKIERRFGLRVALNLIDERQIRSLDTKKFDEMVVSTNVQTSRTTGLPAFGVDVLRDILRAVTGRAPEGSGYKSLTGSDALVLSFERPVTDLPATLRDLYAHYESNRYRASFGWVDHLSEVKDPSLIESLDELVLQQLQRSDTSRTHMAMPENLDWTDIDHFNITPTRKTVYEELDLDHYLAQPLTRAADLTLAKLKSRKVSVKFSRNPEADARWSVYQCLVSEQRFNGSLHALIEGRWFAIADSLVTQVDAAIAAIPAATVTLPPGRPGEAEDAYSARAAASSPDLTLLDRRLVAPEGAHTKIEFCDLLSSDGSIVHVKRKSRSSTLSHLFAQGHVSAQTLVDGGLRDRVRSAIETAAGTADATPWLELIPPGSSPLNRDRLTVTYAIITGTRVEGVEWLPFFSRLTLMQTVRSLNQLGFVRVALLRVPEAP